MTCRILLLFILFILTSGVCAGSFVVNVTQSIYQAKQNHNITLEWSFTINSNFSLNSLSVFCQLLTDVKGFVLLDVHDGVEAQQPQDKHFAGRVHLDKDVLEEGRVRVQVSRLKTTDSGQYRCDVLTSYGTDSEECHLRVSAAKKRPKLGRRPLTRRPQPELGERVIVSNRALRLLAGFLAFLLFTLIRVYANRRR